MTFNTERRGLQTQDGSVEAIMARQMTIRALLVRAATAALVGLAAFAAQSAFAQGSSLHMLDRLAPGGWDVRIRDAVRSVRHLCMESGRPLIQIRHPANLCKSFVVADTPSMVTVHYTCPGAGYGRTTVRYESPILAQVESQGIAEGLPFDFTAEARRTGDCRD